MYERVMPGLKESQEALRLMIKEAETRKDYYSKFGVFAICDFSGSLIAFARMDGAGEEGVIVAMRKAYTAALWGMSTADFRNVCREPVDVSSFGTSFTLSKGGVPVMDPSLPKVPPMAPFVAGAIGVSGVGPGEKDEELAMVGVRYLQSVLWPAKKG